MLKHMFSRAVFGFGLLTASAMVWAADVQSTAGPNPLGGVYAATITLDAAPQAQDGVIIPVNPTGPHIRLDTYWSNSPTLFATSYITVNGGIIGTESVQVLPGLAYYTYVDNATAGWGASAPLYNSNPLSVTGSGGGALNDNTTYNINDLVALKMSDGVGGTIFGFGRVSASRAVLTNAVNFPTPPSTTPIFIGDEISYAYVDVIRVRWNTEVSDGIIVPEPASLSLLLLGGLALIRRRR